ncbi:MAG: hypothetical protein V2A74_15245, partial [bacterium]
MRELGAQFTSNPASVLGHDCAYSIPFPDGRAFWVFGDTLIGSQSPDGQRKIVGMPANTGALVSDRDARNGLHDFTYIADRSGTACAFLVNFPSEHPTKNRLWPSQGVVLTDAGSTPTLYLFSSLVEILEGPPPPGNIKHVGCGIARSPLSRGGSLTVPLERLVRDGKSLFWGSDAPAIGTSVVRASSDTLRVYCSGSAQGRPSAF